MVQQPIAAHPDLVLFLLLLLHGFHLPLVLPVHLGVLFRLVLVVALELVFPRAVVVV